jgi:transcriptional regulator with XRE-family HTH domain
MTSSLGMSKKPKKIPLLVSFGQRLRKIRESQGLSQEDLAFESELDRTYIGSVERGERNISLRNIEKISQALKLDIKDLF